jgi:hypothetical protein
MRWRRRRSGRRGWGQSTQVRHTLSKTAPTHSKVERNPLCWKRPEMPPEAIVEICRTASAKNRANSDVHVAVLTVRNGKVAPEDEQQGEDGTGVVQPEPVDDEDPGHDPQRDSHRGDGEGEDGHEECDAAPVVGR